MMIYMQVFVMVWLGAPGWRHRMHIEGTNTREFFLIPVVIAATCWEHKFFANPIDQPNPAYISKRAVGQLIGARN